MKVKGTGSCMNSMSRTITMQGFILTASPVAVLDEVNFDKVIGA